MKLDRNSNPDGKGKYALIKLRRVTPPFATDGVCSLVPNEVIDFGDTPDTEFFVIRLKDKYAANALQAYAVSCSKDDPEYSREVRELAMRARKHQNQQIPT